MLTETEAPLVVSRPKRYSFAFMVAMLVVAALLDLGPLLIAALFSMLVLQLLRRVSPKPIAIAFYMIAIGAVLVFATWFGKQALVTLPKVAEAAIPKLVSHAQEYGRELPFTDWNSLKDSTLKAVMEKTQYFTTVAGFAEAAARLLIQILIGCVVAVSLFLNSKINLDQDEPDSLYGLCTQQIAERFRTFFGSFGIVMGAQVVISTINTGLTAVFLIGIGLDYHFVLIGITFLCGLLPVVGNLISNVVICSVALTKSPQTALWTLLFLVIVHKLEYFLNSKIVGDRIKNPIWLTLIGLILGELLMGIPGMILAPVFLHYLKVEASRIKLPTTDDDFLPDSADANS